jgi:hypothetical protein
MLRDKEEKKAPTQNAAAGTSDVTHDTVTLLLRGVHTE